MIVNIAMDRAIEKSNIKKKNSFDKEHNKLLDETRMMYFIQSSSIDAGGRFNGLPEKLPLSAENFMKAFEIGVKNSMISEDNSDASIEKKREKEVQELENKVEKAKAADKAKKEAAEELSQKKTMFEEFQKNAPKLTKEKLELVKKVNDAYGITPDVYKDVDKMPIEALKEYISIINM